FSQSPSSDKMKPQQDQHAKPKHQGRQRDPIRGLHLQITPDRARMLEVSPARGQRQREAASLIRSVEIITATSTGRYSLQPSRRSAAASSSPRAAWASRTARKEALDRRAETAASG
ncbi:MAG: hypothetical protein U5L04_07255, partial [Trueperaceae bacterium]|nr:hypothetical protein [Trueperaceae bacterium]